MMQNKAAPYLADRGIKVLESRLRSGEGKHSYTFKSKTIINLQNIRVQPFEI